MAHIISQIFFRLWHALTVIFFTLSLIPAQAQVADTGETMLSLKAYLDAFYSFDFNKPENPEHTRVPYMVNHNRHNEINLNMGFIGLSVKNARYHGTLIFQAGTYPIDNYASEDVVFRFVNEASIGVALTRNGKLWLDGGIIGSHIGWENLFQVKDINLTRSLMVENIPYYFAGAKLTYTFNDRWEAMAMVNNGWQHIKRIDGNSMMSHGTMLKFTPSNKVTLAWNTFIGTDDPDSTRRMRYFNEVYFLWAINQKWNIQTGVDYGLQQKTKGSRAYQSWMLAAFLTQFKFHPQWALGLRAEYAIDKYGIILANPSPSEFNLWGFSANIDFNPLSNIKASVEGRYWQSPDNMFVKDNGFVNTNFFLTFSLVIQFGKDLKL